MALPASSISQMCRAIRQHVHDALNDEETTVQVQIGNPVDAQPGESGSSNVNLFFYRIEPPGQLPDVRPDQTWFVRLYCLATPFAVLENSVSAGESDMRLLGEVVRLFHEQPVFDISIDDETFQTQVIFNSLSLDQINQLWSTQGDVVYRPSVAYEIALAPVVPRATDPGVRLVGAVGREVRADIDVLKPGAATFTTPVVGTSRVDPGAGDWVPLTCLVIDSACARTVSLAVGSPDLAAFIPRVWVAGVVGEEVELRWDVWDAADGWRSITPGTPATIVSDGLDPDAAGSAPVIEIALPFIDRPGQAVLYAARSFTRPADGVTITLRSEPLLVTLYEDTP